MGQGRFDKPKFINEGAQVPGGKFEFLENRFVGTSEVREIQDALNNADNASAEHETKHFFIKQLLVEPASLRDLGGEYREKNNQLDLVHSVSTKLRHHGHTSPTAEDIMAGIQEEAHAEESYLKATAQELIIDKHGITSGANIRITPDGHLRMFDTDRIYPATEPRPIMGSARHNAEAVLDALEYAADHMLDA